MVINDKNDILSVWNERDIDNDHNVPIKMLDKYADINIYLMYITKTFAMRHQIKL